MEFALKDLVYFATVILLVGASHWKHASDIRHLDDVKVDQGPLQETLDKLYTMINDMKVDIATRLARIEARQGKRKTDDGE